LTTTTLTRPRYEKRAVARSVPRWLYWLPLALIIGGQMVQSARLLTSAVSIDEARYIYAGHALLFELLHGHGSPYYEMYFSGAPVVFCPIAGLADSFGGIVAVRLLCLTFVVGASVLLFAAARRLFGHWVGVLAVALFASVNLTYFIGTYANYDSMSLLLLALALYGAVRSRETKWFCLLPLLLLAANATKYMTLLFDPVIIGVAACLLPGWRRRLERILALAAATVPLLLLAVFLAGSAYWDGISFTTLTRSSGTSVLLGAVYRPTSYILHESADWIGLVVVLGVVGVLLALRAHDTRKWLPVLAILAFAGFTVTLEGLHLHSDESMNQHDDFSAFFAAIPAAYALVAMVQAVRSRAMQYAAALVAVTVVGLAWMHGDTGKRVYSLASEASLADYPFYGAMKPYLELAGQHYLIGGDIEFAMLYADHVSQPWYFYSDDSYIKYPIPGRGGDDTGQVRGRACQAVRPGCMYLTGPAGYAAAIRAHFFAFITLVGRHYSNNQRQQQVVQQDETIQQVASTTPGYVLLTAADGAPTWIYLPDYQH
jgi:Dolichyl-phosphate-mannose-protein mannosyltransferase